VGIGNPADSVEVGELVGGYTQLFFDHGLDPQSACPISEPKLRRLSDFLAVSASINISEPSTVLHAFTLLRDRSHALLSVAGGERASEAGKLREDSLSIIPPSSSECSARLVVDYEECVRGTDLTATGRGKKQSKRKKTRAYAVPPNRALELDASTALLSYRRLMTQFGMWPPLAPGEPRFLFPLMALDHKSFQNKPLAATHVRKSLKVHLTAMGEFAGETSHSLKRAGLMLSDLSNEDLARATSLTVPTIQRYRDVRR
jgi:hypothetical protein